MADAADTAAAPAVVATPRWALALLVAVFVGLSLNASLLTPLFESPGESEQLQVSQHWARHGRAPDPARDIWLPVRESLEPPLAAWMHALGLQALDLDDVDFLRRPSAQAPDAFDANRWMHGVDERWPWSDPVWGLHLLRLLGLLAGVATVLGTYALARRAAPHNPSVAFGAAALVALQPVFVQRTASVSAVPLATALCTWGLVAVADLVATGSLGGKRAFVLGLALGAAQVTARAALLLLPLALIAVLLRRRRGRSWGEVLTGWDRLVAGYAVVTGAWFWHNLQTTGRLLPPVPGPGADTGGPWLGGLVTTALDHWLRYTPATDIGLSAVLIWMLVAVGGLLGMLFGRRARGQLDLRVWTLFLCAWIINLVLATGRQALLPEASLYLTIGPLACVLAAGWAPLCRRGWPAVLGVAALLGLTATTFFSQTHVLGPSHWPRERVEDPHFVATNPFEVGPARTRVEAIVWRSPADGEVFVAPPTLRWTPDADLRARYTVHLVAPAQRLRLRSYEDRGQACRDRFDVPASFWDQLPTGAWVAAQIFRLPHRDEILPGDRFNGIIQQSAPRNLQRLRPEDDL